MGRNIADFIAEAHGYKKITGAKANMKKETESNNDYDPHGVYSRDLAADHAHTQAADAEIGDY
jgi:hypothetical protein